MQTDLMAFVGSLESLNDPLHLLLLISSKYPFICVQICFIMANGCIIRQLIVSSHANIIVLLKFVCGKSIIQKCKLLLIRDNKFYFFKNENTFTTNECQRKVLFIY